MRPTLLHTLDDGWQTVGATVGTAVLLVAKSFAAHGAYASSCGAAGSYHCSAVRSRFLSFHSPSTPPRAADAPAACLDVFQHARPARGAEHCADRHLLQAFTDVQQVRRAGLALAMSGIQLFYTSALITLRSVSHANLQRHARGKGRRQPCPASLGAAPRVQHCPFQQGEAD